MRKRNELTATIEVNGLRLTACHGVMEQERKVGNEFEVTAHLTADVMEALTDDSIESTINYAEVVEIISLIMKQPVNLLEHAAYQIKRALTAAYPNITSGMVRVVKLTPPIPAQMESVAVTLRW